VAHHGNAQPVGNVDVPLEAPDFRPACLLLRGEQVRQNGVIRERQRQRLRRLPDAVNQRLIEFVAPVIVQGEAEGHDFHVFRAAFRREPHGVQDGFASAHNVGVEAVAGQSDFHGYTPPNV